VYPKTNSPGDSKQPGAEFDLRDCFVDHFSDGFITGADNQGIKAFLRRSKRCGYCPPDLPDFVQLVEEGDERLFTRINNNSSHVLRGLLPPPSMATQQYSLRRRPHDRQMPDHTGHLADKNFLIRMLFKDSY